MKYLKSGLATALTCGVASILMINQASATTLTGFMTTGADMGGMEVTVNFFDGTSETQIWAATDAISGGSFGTDWQLTQSGNTFASFNNPFTFQYTGSSSVSGLYLDAHLGNAAFDILPDITGPNQTPGSADGNYFQLTSGTAPTTILYSLPIDISQGDLFGRLSLEWAAPGFTGTMTFLSDTDSGTTFDPITPTGPIPALPSPPSHVPEPSSSTLALLGCMVFFWRRRTLRTPA